MVNADIAGAIYLSVQVVPLVKMTVDSDEMKKIDTQKNK